MTAHRLTSATIDDEAALRALLGAPSEVVQKKVADHLTPISRKIIERSPFVCLATSDAAGRCDVSPRGDPAGFVRILDDRTLLLPDRPGNRIVDALRNILQNPHAGLMFVIPGLGDTFRVNGRATIITDEALLEPCSVEGKRPRLGILIDIEEAYTHCAKAFLRADLWNPERYVSRSELPTTGDVYRALHPEVDAANVEATDRDRAERYARREGFY
jgi:uncharacterized protein